MSISHFASQAWGRFSSPFDRGSLFEGKIIGSDHWERVEVTKGEAQFDSYLDKSTGNLYGYWGCGVIPLNKGSYSSLDFEPEFALKRAKGFVFLVFTPLYFVGVELFQLVKLLPKITYFALRIIYDKIALTILENRELEEGSLLHMHKVSLEKRGSSLSDIAARRVLEIIEEIGKCLSTALYATILVPLMAMSCIYMLFDPLNGGKCLSSFEKKLWNVDSMEHCVMQVCPTGAMQSFIVEPTREKPLSIPAAMEAIRSGKMGVQEALNATTVPSPAATTFSDRVKAFFDEEVYKIEGFIAAPCMQPVGSLQDYDLVRLKKKSSTIGTPKWQPAAPYSQQL